MKNVERTSTEVYIDHIGGQHRKGCDGGRIGSYVINGDFIKGNHCATGRDVADALNQRGNYTRDWYRKKMANTSQNDRPTPVFCLFVCVVFNGTSAHKGY